MLASHGSGNDDWRNAYPLEVLILSYSIPTQNWKVRIHFERKKHDATRNPVHLHTFRIERAPPASATPSRYRRGAALEPIGGSDLEEIVFLGNINCNNCRCNTSTTGCGYTRAHSSRMDLQQNRGYGSYS